MTFLNHSTDPTPREPALSVILPASNEAGLIGMCLDAVAASTEVPGGVEVVVVANGCSDDTATRARAHARRFADRGWRLEVIERDEGNKTAALNAGDSAARSGARAYLDADVVVAPTLLAETVQALTSPGARFVSGRLVFATPASGWSRAYARFWRRVPFMAEGVPGCGFFAVNADGRSRWGAFPDIVSDDTFARLHFAPDERRAVAAPYSWPVVEGLTSLVRVRRRQDRGVEEVRRRFPELVRNEDALPFPTAAKARAALADPAGFAVYAGVAAAVRLTPRTDGGWSRGR